MEKVIPGDGVAGLHQVCSCAILNLTEKSLGCMDFSSKETTVVLLVERRYNRECQTQLWSQSQSLFEIIGCAWILKEMEISGGCVSWCHFIPEGLRIPSKQEQSFKTCLWDFLQWLYWLFPCIIILGLFYLLLGRLSSLQLLPLCSSLLVLCMSLLLLPYHHFLVTFACLDST